MIRLAFIATLVWIAAAFYVLYCAAAHSGVNGNQVLFVLGVTTGAIIGYAAIDQRERRVQELRLRLKRDE